MSAISKLEHLTTRISPRLTMLSEIKHLISIGGEHEYLSTANMPDVCIN